MDKDKTIFSELIKAERLKRNMLQKDFAALLGVKERTLSFWETGAREPGVSTLYKIAQALGKEVELK